MAWFYKQTKSVSKMRVSLILATLGLRRDELKRLFDSLQSQTYKNFELIIVDQRGGDDVKILVKEYESFLSINHIVVNSKGLSKARNIGLDVAKGDILAFPDDDCWYPKDLLERVVSFFKSNPGIFGLSGVTKLPSGEVVVGRFDKTAGFVSKYNVWHRVTSAALFLRREVVSHVGYFDQDLGLGANTPWQSSEDIDYPLRIINNGFKIFFDPNLVVYHPDVKLYDNMHRAYYYAQGMGRVLKKHNYPFWFVGYYLLRPIVGIVFAIFRRDKMLVKYYSQVFWGRVRGFGRCFSDNSVEFSQQSVNQKNE